jgi:predicted transcriptional regulator of viral defense system
MSDPSALARKLIRKHGTARSRDLEAAGLARSQLTRLVASGALVRIARGLYALPERAPDANESLIVVAQRSPQAIFCLLTALRFHELTTQAPFEVWLAIGPKDRAPKLDWPPLRVMRFSGAALEAGIETHVVDGVPLRVTGVARTVADCFKFRNKIGVDVALEALRDAWRERRVPMDELWRYAVICRVGKVMRPYLESLV